MADDKFPLPGSSYKELSKIVAGYAVFGAPAAPADVSKTSTVHADQVSRSNKFLVQIGVIQGGQKKQCTEIGYALGLAIQHDQADVISTSWRKIAGQVEFLQRIVSAVRIRKGMEESALLSHIAFTSGNPKSAYGMAGAGAIVEILKLSRLLSENGGTLVVNDLIPESEESIDTLVPIERTELERANEPSKQLTFHERVRRSNDNYRQFSGLTISLTIKCTPTELDGLGQKLRALVAEFEGTDEIKLNLADEDAEAD
jgi:hypothetical protein